MASMREEPLYNLKAVVQQTGLKPDTLRAWERRYGVPAPERSEGGHRIYSRRDIEIIRWLMARQREGLSISRAVELWQQLEASGRDPLESALPIATPAAAASVGYAGETVAELREDWISACLGYDEREAEQILAQAFALYPPELVAVELLQKAVAEIGDGWYRGDVTVQQEHFCSGLAIRHLEALVMGAAAPTRPGRILVACPPEENHVIGLLVLTFLLRRRGWEVVYLGANVPSERLETTISAAKPQLIIFSAQQLHSAASLLDMAEVLRRERIPLAYGGLIFNLIPELRKRIPGHFLGERLDQAPAAVERLMTARPPLPGTVQACETCGQAREHFRDRQGLIEAELAQEATQLSIAPWHLALANHELGHNIGAALVLGDMDYLGTDLEWVQGLIGNRELPAQVLPRYLQAYRQAAEKHLDERAEPILDWFDRVLDGSGSSPSQ
jgi:DNA-binding transcriptional MerR regulator/methylmalonyl-CoA mutase cobalamin-binding subunit